ncbi:MAG: alpha/beta hydrolase [Bacteroidota bacterium]
MSTPGSFIRDVAQLPAYRKRLKEAGYTWLDRVETVEYAPPYRGTWGQKRSRKMLRLMPKGGVDAVKAWVVYLHGGAWAFGRPDDFLAVANCFVPEGFGLIMPTYRRLPRYHGGNMIDDLRLALVECAKRGWILPTQQAPLVSGMSSGGHLAAILGLSPTFWEDAGWPRPQKVICCGAPLDLDLMPSYPGMNLLFRGQIEINPKKILAHCEEIPPFMILHPTKDGMAPARQAASFYRALRKKSDLAQIHWIANKGHLAAGEWMFTDGEIRRKICAFSLADTT